jgi:hypothetical protein
MQITEPATMLTDYGLAVLCGIFTWRLFQGERAQHNTSVWLWAWGFTFFGMASLLGGTYHGFSQMLSEAVSLGLWKATVYAIGFASFCLLTGTLFACVLQPLRRYLLLIAALQLTLYAIWMISHDDFRYVIYNYVPSMTTILLLQAYAYIASDAQSAPWIIGGILITFMAAVVQASGVSLHRDFNHNDLYHVIQMGGFYLLFRGARLLVDR